MLVLWEERAELDVGTLDEAMPSSEDCLPPHDNGLRWYAGYSTAVLNQGTMPIAEYTLYLKYLLSSILRACGPYDATEPTTCIGGG